MIRLPSTCEARTHACLLLLAFAFPCHAATPVHDLRTYAQQSFALVRNAAAGAGNQIDLVLFDAASKQVKSRHPLPLRCERIHMARQTIFCLGVPKRPGQGGPADFAVTDFTLRTDFAGSVPHGVTVSRARMAPNATYAASTIFVTGHSYGTAMFSTEVNIIEISQRKLTLPSLEYWNTWHNNTRVNARDLNFWGVSFDPTDADRFYVTAAFGRKIFLGRGSIGRRHIDLLLPDIECPSVSPDGTRLAFKKRRGKGWVPAVLDLTTHAITTFNEPKSVDDQIEWLDNQTLVYEISTPLAASAKTDLMTVDVRRPDAPSRLWLADAGSPTINRVPSK